MQPATEFQPTPIGLIQAAQQRNRAFIDTHARSHVLVHAGVVALGDCTLVIPGASESGKSTLVAGLVRSGWEYLSDELAVIDPLTLTLEPYQRPISIDVGAYGLFPELSTDRYSRSAEQWHVDPSDLRPDCLARGGRRVTHIVFNRYMSGATTHLEAVPPGQCLHGLLENALRLPNQYETGFATLADVAETASAARLLSGRLEEQIDALTSLGSW